MTDIKPSQAAVQTAQVLTDYLDIRGLKDGEVLRAFARFEAETRKDALSGMPTILEDPAGKGYPCFERPMTPTEAKERIDRLSSDLVIARENCAKIADSHDSWVGGEIAAAIRNQEQP